MAESIPLSETAATIAKRFVLIDGLPQMSTEDLELSCREMKAIKQVQREELAAELVALSLHYNEVLGTEAAGVSLEQLLFLTAMLVEDYVKTKELFEKQGVDLSSAAKFLDADVKNRPVKTEPLSQGQNLFSLLRKK